MEFKNEYEKRTFYFVELGMLKKYNGIRDVKIEFINHQMSGWKFDGCQFNVESIPYNLNDWEFLKKVAEKIEELSKTLNL